MNWLGRTFWIGVAFVSVVLLALTADFFRGPFDFMDRRGGVRGANSGTPVTAVWEIDTQQLCHAYWTPISRIGTEEPRAPAGGSDLVGSTALGVALLDGSAVDFVRDIRPIFVEHCYECHGQDQHRGGLRLDQAESLFRSAESGDHPVAAGDAAHSSLIARVTSDDADLRMPAEKEPLSTEHISRLRDWINQGALLPDDARHWSFVPPRRPPLPHVHDRNWPRNPIDRFVLARLEREGLAPSPEAERTTLIRRLSLDLTGLPPTPEEVGQFLRDGAPFAYERLADRLLASPHFGERWAVRWLDLARYADTNGFTYDAPREIWLYRDWVINALNTDKPFDVFTIEQLAGDLVPRSTDEQKIATGFLRSQVVEVDVEHYRFGEMVDRVNTIGTLWLGLSLGCAQCHDHKYDPITQKEFYQLYAAVNTTADEVEAGELKRADFKARSPLNGREGATLVVTELSERPATHFKIRGSFLQDGEEVQPGVPAVLHRPACGLDDRLGLACWIVDPENPLTARVTVNRFWEAVFGIGLVRTSEDLGTRSEPPSHPQLLDWLAIEFQRSGWSMKALLRLMVTSAAYRQSSHVSSELLVHDPENRLLARGPRFRLDAELVRDVVLSAAGVLSDQLGGPSVFPPQPEGISENRLFGSFDWNTNTDDRRYRRGLYTFWKRAALYPSLELFDARNRTASCPRRTRSTTPVQALATLNDPAFFEAAVLLGRRIMAEAGPGPEPRIAHGFRVCLARRPTDDELDRLLVYYREEHDRWNLDATAAAELVGTDQPDGEHQDLDVRERAAWTMVANVLLNLDETITKD